MPLATGSRSEDLRSEGFIHSSVSYKAPLADVFYHLLVDVENENDFQQAFGV